MARDLLIESARDIERLRAALVLAARRAAATGEANDDKE